jgi:NAD+ synthase
MSQNQALAISNWIREQVGRAGGRGAVFGLSGGVDSAVVAALCKEATGKDALGLIMSCHSLDEDIAHARLVADTFQVKTLTVDLSLVFDSLKALLPEGNQLAYANLKPRLRMMTLYYFANLNHYLVIGTGNKSEISVGYFTKYGDGGVDVLPLGDFLKSEVRELARSLKVPRVIIDKPPSAGLWAGQTDESEMGVTYEEIDNYLKGLEEKTTSDLNSQVKNKINAMMMASEHKRASIPIYYRKKV